MRSCVENGRALLAKIVLGLTFVLSPIAASAIDLGSKAPDFALPQLTGSDMSLASQQGKVVYLDFWASWCSTCKATLPFMNELQAKYGAQGLQVIAVNLDSDKASVESALKAINPKYSVVLDPNSSVVEKYSPTSIPTSFVIDRNGVITDMHTGFCSETKESIEREIKKLLGV